MFCKFDLLIWLFLCLHWSESDLFEKISTDSIRFDSNWIGLDWIREKGENPSTQQRTLHTTTTRHYSNYPIIQPIQPTSTLHHPTTTMSLFRVTRLIATTRPLIQSRVIPSTMGTRVSQQGDTRVDMHTHMNERHLMWHDWCYLQAVDKNLPAPFRLVVCFQSMSDKIQEKETSHEKEVRNKYHQHLRLSHQLEKWEVLTPRA